MKALKKYAYMSPETEVLSLGAERIIMTSPEGGEFDPDNPADPDPSEYNAPWRF